MALNRPSSNRCWMVSVIVPVLCVVLAAGATVQADGTLPLYLHSEPLNHLSFSPPGAGQPSVLIIGDDEVSWTLAPPLAAELVVSGNAGTIPVELYLARNFITGTSNRRLTVTLSSAALGVIGSVGPHNYQLDTTPQVVVFDIPVAGELVLPEGDTLQLTLFNQSGHIFLPRWIYVHPAYGAGYSRVLLETLSFPDMQLDKTVAAESDPFNAHANPKAVPGAHLRYTVTVTNRGVGPPDADSVVVVDAIPAHTALFVGDLDGAGAGPVRFVDGHPSSGLTYTFNSLGDADDDAAFSNNHGATFDYTPTPDGSGFDDAVTHVRINPKGVFNGAEGGAAPSFALQFRVRVQ